MLKCNKDNIIYVICGAEYKTGGTELLHQLVFSLKNLGLNAYITYMNVNNNKCPINDAFKKYVNEYKRIEEVKDNKKNIIILPEINVNLIDRFKESKIVVWWLSVDNYLKAYTLKHSYKLLGYKGVIWYLKNKNWKYNIKSINKKIELNFAQSYYAMDFLEKNKFNGVTYLSDYISDSYLENINKENKTRENIVLYNPKKGIKFTKKIIRLLEEVECIPIINMTNDQVRDLLEKSKVYIDFGNHPGKDRFPREAAYCGCCIITGKDGSAGYFDDVPINENYKFNSTEKNISEIVENVKKCIENYDICKYDFDNYREIIKNEKKQFEKDVKRLFID